MSSFKLALTDLEPRDCVTLTDFAPVYGTLQEQDFSDELLIKISKHRFACQEFYRNVVLH
jgi:hypothetical protein